MRVFDAIFGNSLFTINFFAVFLTSCAAYFIFRIALLLSRRFDVALAAAALWFVSAHTTVALIFKSTYDSLEALFWMMTVYLVLSYVTTKLNRYLYCAGMTLGFLLLGKYTGFILGVAILVYLTVFLSQRSVFKNQHFYFSALLVISIFMPNLIWNWQHN